MTLRGPITKERPALTTHTIARKNVAGEVLGEVALAPNVFGLTPNGPVLHQVVVAQLAARRSGTQSTKGRAEVRGGGRKPFRQKGTGNARQGSSRSPLMTGGGVIHAPKPRSYAQRTPKKMVRLALYSALSARATDGAVHLVDAFTLDEPKTREAVAALGALALTGTGLVVLPSSDELALRALGNLPHVTTIDPGELNPYDVLNVDWILFTDATLPSGGDA